MSEALRFWWRCACFAARGTVTFANDWGWLFGAPGTAMVFSLLAATSGTTLTGNIPLDALLAGSVTFVITWFVIFFVRLVGAPAALYREALGHASEDVPRLSGHANTKLDAIKIEHGNAPPLATVEALNDGRVRKAFSVAVVNIGNGLLSNCRLHLTGLAPNDSGWHLPLQLHAEPFTLPKPSERQIIDIISYLERAADFRIKLPPTGLASYDNSLPTKPYVLTLEASADQTKSTKLLCRVWIDANGQFQLQDAASASARPDPQAPATSAIAQRPLAPKEPVKLALKWIPSAGEEDIVAVFTVAATNRAKDIAFIGRYAEATHYLDKVEWTWTPSIRLREMAQISPPENWEIEAVRRPRYKQTTATIFGQSVLDIKDDTLVLVRLDVVCDGHAQHIAKAFNLTPSSEGKVLQYVNLDDVAYIKGLEPDNQPPIADERTPLLKFLI